MPYDLTTKDGITIRNIPDDVPSDSQELKDRVTKIRSGNAPTASTADKALASPVARLFRGAVLDPVDAGAQLVPRGLEFISSIGGFYPNSLSEFFGDEAKRVDKINSERDTNFEWARKATGQDGIDAWRLAGNVVSPANKAIAAVAPMKATTTLGRAAEGAITGGIGAAALSPVNVSQDESFAGAKALQTALGAGAGGVAAPVIGKTLDAVAPRLAALIQRWKNPEILGARASLNADQLIAEAMQDAGQKMSDLPDEYVKQLRQQVVNALKQGQKFDAAAAIRKRDFDSLHLPYTLGQVTREPGQYALEQNLRAAEQGKDLLARFDYQNRSLQDMVGGLSQGAESPYQAGKQVIGNLQSIDNKLKSVVDAAYEKARDHVGRAAPMDVPGFSQSANLALDDGMLGHSLPTDVRNILNDVSSGKIPFNVNTAVQIDSVLSAAQRKAGKGTPEWLAIGKVRDALNNAGIADNVGEDAKAAFDAARGLAKQRFSAHERVPALGEVASGDAVPDNFVRQFVMNGNIEDVHRLAGILSPDAKEQVRAQLGAELQRGAFGENQAQDKLFTPERFNRKLREIGEEKLSAFFSPQEIEQMKVMSRVAAYINSKPSAAPVMGNPNMFWAADLISRVPGAPKLGQVLMGAGKAAATAVNRQKMIADALKAEVPKEAADLTPQQQAALAKLLTGSSTAAGILGASPIR